jgi:hypothetical protein
VDVVRHYDPREQAIPVSVEVPKRFLDHRCDRGIAEMACAASRIELFLDRADDLGRERLRVRGVLESPLPEERSRKTVG